MIVAPTNFTINNMAGKKGSTKKAPPPAKGSPPKKDFSKFMKKGYVPKKSAAVNSKIQMCLMKGHVGVHIVNLVKISKTPWTEKIMNDVYVETKGAVDTFLSQFNVVEYDHQFFLHSLDVKQKHSDDLPFHIRYFPFRIDFEDDVPKDTKVEFLRQMAEEICEGVNALQREGAAIVTVPDADEDLIYAPREDMVLSDVVGRKEATKYLRTTLGQNYAMPFDENKDFVHQIFRSGEIPENLQTFLSAPVDEVWTGF